MPIVFDFCQSIAASCTSDEATQPAGRICAQWLCLLAVNKKLKKCTKVTNASDLNLSVVTKNRTYMLLSRVQKQYTSNCFYILSAQQILQRSWWERERERALRHFACCYMMESHLVRYLLSVSVTWKVLTAMRCLDCSWLFHGAYVWNEHKFTLCVPLLSELTVKGWVANAWITQRIIPKWKKWNLLHVKRN